MKKMCITTQIQQQKSSFSNLMVHDAMRRRVINLSPTSDLESAIAKFIKHKANALLIIDNSDFPIGVVSKTEIIGAFYASLPVTTISSDIMSSPVSSCHPDESLEHALTKMQEKKIHRLYVIDRKSQKAIGTLAYPDIVGLLYRYCHNCEFSRRVQQRTKEETSVIKIKVSDIMTTSVMSAQEGEPLDSVIEKLSTYHLGALLIKDKQDTPSGVISKTDLALAYKHGMGLQLKAREIMTSPVCSCDESENLETSIHKMIFSEINRLFVYRNSPDNIIGVLSLSDAAKVRSGSCQACTGSRFIV